MNEYENYIAEDLKEDIKEIIEELHKNYNLPFDLEAFSEIDSASVKKFCQDKNVRLTEEYNNAINSPYKLAKYLQLVVQEDKNIKKLNAYFNKHLDKQKVNWIIHQDFTNKVTFTKVIPINSDEKPQNLNIQYRIDADSEDFRFYIKTGYWGWDISLPLLKALLGIDTFTCSADTDTTLKVNSEFSPIKLEVNNMKITITSK